MPDDLGGGSLGRVWVLEDHECLGGVRLREMLWLLASEVLLEEIDLVVLHDRLGSTVCHVLGGLGEAEGRVSVQLLHVLGLISWFGGLNI